MKKLSITIIVLFIAFTSALIAQDLNDAGMAYNEGAEMSKEGNMLEALASFKECASICEELGEEGVEWKQKAETQICNLYIKMGLDIYKAKKYDSAIVCFTESAKYADLIDNAETSAKVSNYLAAAYTGKGNSLLSKKKYEEAIVEYNKAIEHKASYTKAYYGLVLGYSKTGDASKMEESIAGVLTLTTDEKLITKTKTAASKYYLKATASALKDEDYQLASEMSNKCIEYNDTDPNAYYYLALSSNNIENYDAAQQAALHGLSIDQEDKSNLYFELARAYEAKGETEQACSTYEKVKTGPNTQAAIYQRTQVLKCN